MKITRPFLLLLLAIASHFSLSPCAQAADPLQVANSITGLVVHVGCGDASLTVTLTDFDRRTVQGLCTPNQLNSARNRVLQTPGAPGIVSIRSVPNFLQLPYSRNLADLVVADLETLGAASVR